MCKSLGEMFSPVANNNRIGGEKITTDSTCRGVVADDRKRRTVRHGDPSFSVTEYGAVWMTGYCSSLFLIRSRLLVTYTKLSTVKFLECILEELRSESRQLDQA